MQYEIKATFSLNTYQTIPRAKKGLFTVPQPITGIKAVYKNNFELI